MKPFHLLAAVALALCATVVVFGAYVRLSDAGLGCPDWPGCYGRLAVPTGQASIDAAQQQFPDRPLEHGKASKEMIHRYLASTLGLVIVALAALSFRPQNPKVLPRLLVALVVLQGLLGMWTVTWLLKPLVVTAHLLGGLTTLALLGWLFLETRRTAPAPAIGETASGYLRQIAQREEGYRNEREAMAGMQASVRTGPRKPSGLRLAAGVGLALLAVQIFLGGWTSSNYAALACPDLPTCQNRWWPEMDLGSAFTPWHGDVNYEHGVLDNRARVTIHWLHRVGALTVSVFLAALGSWLWRRGGPGKRHGVAICALLTLQVAIGASMVWLQLPLPLAVAHNAGAALLLLALVNLNHFAWRKSA